MYFAGIFIEIHIIKDVISSKYSRKMYTVPLQPVPTSRRGQRLVARGRMVIKQRLYSRPKFGVRTQDKTMECQSTIVIVFSGFI